MRSGSFASGGRAWSASSPFAGFLPFADALLFDGSRVVPALAGAAAGAVMPVLGARPMSPFDEIEAAPAGAEAAQPVAPQRRPPEQPWSSPVPVVVVSFDAAVAGAAAPAAAEEPQPHPPAEPQPRTQPSPRRRCSRPACSRATPLAPPRVPTSSPPSPAAAVALPTSRVPGATVPCGITPSNFLRLRCDATSSFVVVSGFSPTTSVPRAYLFRAPRPCPHSRP